MIKIQNWCQKRQMMVLTFKCANNFNVEIRGSTIIWDKVFKNGTSKS